MRTIAEWKEIAFSAKHRETAMFALGVAAGLEWAKEQQNEADLVLSIPPAAMPKGEPERS